MVATGPGKVAPVNMDQGITIRQRNVRWAASSRGGHRADYGALDSTEIIVVPLGDQSRHRFGLEFDALDDPLGDVPLIWPADGGQGNAAPERLGFGLRSLRDFHGVLTDLERLKDFAANSIVKAVLGLTSARSATMPGELDGVIWRRVRAARDLRRRDPGISMVFYHHMSVTTPASCRATRLEPTTR